MTSFDKEFSHVPLLSIIACLDCKSAYTSMRNRVGPLGSWNGFSYRLGMGDYCCSISLLLVHSAAYRTSKWVW